MAVYSFCIASISFDMIHEPVFDSYLCGRVASIPRRRQLAARQFQLADDGAVLAANQSKGDLGIRNRGVDCELAKGILSGDTIELCIPIGLGRRGTGPAAQASRFKLVEVETGRPRNAKSARAVPVT